MSHPTSSVHLIVAKEFGDRLWGMETDAAIWVANTASNQRVIERIWSERFVGDVPSSLHGITSFQVAPDGAPEDWLMDIVGQVELHHGEFSQSPPYSELRVFGSPLSPRLRAEFGKLGFVRFEDLEEGFVAYKSSVTEDEEMPL